MTLTSMRVIDRRQSRVRNLRHRTMSGRSGDGAHYRPSRSQNRRRHHLLRNHRRRRQRTPSHRTGRTFWLSREWREEIAATRSALEERLAKERATETIPSLGVVVTHLREHLASAQFCAHAVFT
jgi:hypothetical protein